MSDDYRGMLYWSEKGPGRNAGRAGLDCGPGWRKARRGSREPLGGATLAHGTIVKPFWQTEVLWKICKWKESTTVIDKARNINTNQSNPSQGSFKFKAINYQCSSIIHYVTTDASFTGEDWRPLPWLRWLVVVNRAQKIKTWPGPTLLTSERSDEVRRKPGYCHLGPSLVLQLTSNCFITFLYKTSSKPEVLYSEVEARCVLLCYSSLEPTWSQLNYTSTWFNGEKL